MQNVLIADYTAKRRIYCKQRQDNVAKTRELSSLWLDRQLFVSMLASGSIVA